MSKTRATSTKRRASSGDVQGQTALVLRSLVPLVDVLGELGRDHYPLRAAALLDSRMILETPAVVARAGIGAPEHHLIDAAGEVVREIVAHMRDETYKRTAEAALATDSGYEGKGIGERQELLYKRHGISKYVYEEQRPKVFREVAYELMTYRATSEASGIRPLYVGEVAAIAGRLYFASLASRILIAERRRLLGDEALLAREPNLILYDAHVTFLLTVDLYLYTISPVEVESRDELTGIFQRAVENGPLPNAKYLAHIYGGRDEPYHPPGTSKHQADRLLRTTWKAWYDRQETIGAAAKSELYALSLTALTFCNTLPMTPQLEPEDFGQFEQNPSSATAAPIFQAAATYEPPDWPGDRTPDQSARPLVLADVLKTASARKKWFVEVDKQLKKQLGRELKEGKVNKQWDNLIAHRLHMQ